MKKFFIPVIAALFAVSGAIATPRLAANKALTDYLTNNEVSCQPIEEQTDCFVGAPLPCLSNATVYDINTPECSDIKGKF